MDIRRRLLSNDILNNNIFIIESDELLNPIRVSEGCVFWVPLNSEGDEGITDVISGNKIIYHSGGMEFNNDTNMYKFTTTSSNSTYIDINFNSDTFPDNVCTFIAKINILTRNSNLYVYTHSIDDKNIYFQAPINNTAESRTTSYDEGLINAVSYFGDLTYWINNNKKYTMSADSNRRPWAWCNSDIMKFARYVSGTLNSQFEMSNFMIFNRELTSEEINDYIENGIAIQTLYPNCKSLSITANDVSGRDTNTTINYVAEIEYYTENGVLNHTITKTGTLLSAEFPLNTSYDKVIKREIGFKIFGKIAKTTITQGVWTDLEYTINLNSQWLKSSITNPDSSLYDGVYESYSNKGVNSSGASMYITINGYENFKLYIRSYAESSYDYVMVSQLDKTLTYSSSYSNTSLVKAHTRGSQNSGTSIGSYKLVEFTNIDGGEHTILIIYRKDSSASSGNDCGYVLIPKLQENDNNSGEGDVDIDTTYSILYTSNINNIIAPYSTYYFGANIISNAYVNGLGIITFDGPVTLIGSNAFNSCTSLTSITIPNSVTSIGYNAFKNCSSLASINIPDSVTSIEQDAFFNCSSLTSIIISNRVTEIEDRVFAGCSSLTSITIPFGVTSIGYNAFSGCSSLASITIPNSVTSIGNGAFLSCSNIIEVHISSIANWCTINFTSFESNPLRYAKKLYLNGKLITDLVIPRGTNFIRSYAFYNCDYFTSIEIPNSVTSIGDLAFYKCSSFTSIEIPNSVTSIGGGAFSGCSSLTSVNILDGLKTIGNSAFSSCSSLTSITIPNSVTSIGKNVFDGCKLLPIINYIRYADTCLIEVIDKSHDSYFIEDNTRIILFLAFSYCNSLTSIVIPENVILISSFALRDCKNLTSIYCKPVIPPNAYRDTYVDWGAFNNVSPDFKIYVPTASVDAYKLASGWSDYADHIVGYDF